jgi:hypothetical protein
MVSCVYVENEKNYEPLTGVVQEYLYLMNLFFLLEEEGWKVICFDSINER